MGPGVGDGPGTGRGHGSGDGGQWESGSTTDTTDVETGPGGPGRGGGWGPDWGLKLPGFRGTKTSAGHRREQEDTESPDQWGGVRPERGDSVWGVVGTGSCRIAGPSTRSPGEARRRTPSHTGPRRSVTGTGPRRGSRRVSEEWCHRTAVDTGGRRGSSVSRCPWTCTVVHSPSTRTGLGCGTLRKRRLAGEGLSEHPTPLPDPPPFRLPPFGPLSTPRTPNP